MHFKRYGQMKNLKDEDRREPPAYIYKAAFINLEEPQYNGRMRTRRSSTPIFTNGNNMRIRVLQEGWCHFIAALLDCFCVYNSKFKGFSLTNK